MYKILAKTLFLGKQVFYMPTCHSTNDTAMDMLENSDIPEGAVIITDNQTSGKGQRGNDWATEPAKNLTVSLVLKPTFLAIKDQFHLNMVVSLALADLLRNSLKDAEVKVKWPNDIYVNEKKIAGILIENTLKSTFLESSVVGVGLNVHQTEFKYPKATSMRLVTDEPLKLHDVFEELMLQIEKYYLRLKSGDFDFLRTEYMTHLLGYEQERTFRSEYEFKGVIKGLSGTGRLIVSENGRSREFDLKEIEFL